jgi:hypothetical protein
MNYLMVLRQFRFINIVMGPFFFFLQMHLFKIILNEKYFYHPMAYSRALRIDQNTLPSLKSWMKEK